MFRRRSLRPLRPMGRPMPVLPPAANALMVEGNYKAAAEAFELLASGAEIRFPRRAHGCIYRPAKTTFSTTRWKLGRFISNMVSPCWLRRS